MQTIRTQTAGNRVKLERAETALAELMADTLRRGYYGRAMLEFVIEDGTIQYVRRMQERVER